MKMNRKKRVKRTVAVVMAASMVIGTNGLQVPDNATAF